MAEAQGPKYVKPLQKQQNENTDASSAELNDAEEDWLTDILSSDSDNSSIDMMKEELLTAIARDALSEGSKEEQLTEYEETLERMAFYSMYMEDNYHETGPPRKPQYSDGYENFKPYSGIEAYIKDWEAKQYILEDFDHEEFKKLLNADLPKDVCLDDIDGNVSIKTLAKANFDTLGMGGPTRKIALIFNCQTEDSISITTMFRDFMNEQREKFTYIGGVLLFYDEIGIHVVEGSEYVFLRHFPMFFESEMFKKLTTCKVLGLEELSAMKSFKQYACYKGTPPVPKEMIKNKLSSYSDSIKFLKKLGKCLNIFFKFAYEDKANVFEDNTIPENVTASLPPKEYLEFALKGDWKPGLRVVDDWFYNATVIPTEVDDSEFVLPPRSDHTPVHVLHPNPEEDKNLLKIIKEKMKSVKLPCSKGDGYAVGRTESEKSEPREESCCFNIENLIDEDYQYPTPPLSVHPEGAKGYNSQSSDVDSEELNTDLEDFKEHLENVYS